jgi:subfamily B ATP-binding cassette protein MsbA
MTTAAQPILKRLLRYVTPYRWVVVPVTIAIVVYALVTGLVPFFVQDIFDKFQEEALQSAADAGDWVEALKLPLAILLIFGVRGATNFLTIYGLSWVGRSAVRDLRASLFRHYLFLPAAYYDRHTTGGLISRLTFNTEQVAEAISNAIVNIVRDCLLVIVMFGIMLYFSVELTLILSIVGPVVALLLAAMSRAFRRYSTRIQDSMGDVTRVVSQALHGQRVVKIFDGQDFESARFADINARNFRLNLRLVATRAFGDALTQFVVMLGVAVVGFFVFSGFLEQGVDAAEFSAFVTAVGILLTSLKRLVGMNALLQRGIAAGESVFDILDEPVEQFGAAVSDLRVTGAIEFSGVGFSYPETGERVLSDIDFSLEPGQSLAIVGRSGSGKSTLVSLLPRFYDVSAGTIRLDGRDIRDYSLRDLRQQISFVSQDVVLFDDTIAGNIAYGALANASRQAIERAAELAHVNSFAADMPDKLDSEVGEDGNLLSGGQRQRIAIARAILKDSPVLILDEATSSLDSESERHVQSALKELMAGRTTLIVAHRLSTVEQADRIVVMSEGRIVETGTHSGLLAAGGHYASLYRLQFAD